MDFLISPAEPPVIRAIGTTSQIPEKHGFDVLWMERTVNGLIGIQRKEFGDLLNSMRDGRLAREVGQFGGSPTVKLAFLIIEGKPHWTPDGMLINLHHTWTRVQYNSLLRSVQHRGIITELTENLVDTSNRIFEIAKWCGKADHLSLERRAGPTPDSWGRVTERGWASHLLQSVPGIGPKQAQAIYDHFDGRIPIGLTCTRTDLLDIKGLGAKRVEALERAFQLSSGEHTSSSGEETKAC